MVKRTIQVLILAVLAVILFFVARRTLALYYHAQATRLYEQGAYSQAIGLLKRSIALDPTKSTAYYNLGAAYAMSRSYEVALQQYRKALELNPLSIAAYSGLIQAYVSLKRYDEALAELDHARNFYPDDENLKSIFDDAVLSYAIDCLNRGVDSYFKGDTQGAYRLFQQAIQVKPDFAFAHYLLGFLYYQDRDLASAERSISRAVSLNAGLWLAQRLLGDIAFERGQYTRAIEYYTAGLASNRTDPALYNELGLAYMQLEDYRQAAINLEAACKLDPENLDRLYNLASVYRDNRDFETAIEKYQLLIARQQDYLNAHNDLGDIYKRQDRIPEALREYQQEIYYTEPKSREYPGDVTLLNILANAYRGLNDYARAEQLIRRALTLQPQYRQGYLTLASIQQDAGDFRSSIVSLEKAKSLPGVTNYIERGKQTLEEALHAAGTGGQGFADTVFLKNGRTLRGLIVEETPEKVVLEIPLAQARGSVTIYRKDIRSVARDSSAEPSPVSPAP